MFFEPPQPTVVPRRVQCPVDEVAPVVCLNPLFNQPSITVLATFIKKARDTLDYGIDFTQWVQANGNTEIKDVVWADAADGAAAGILPAPMVGNQFFPGGECWVVIGPGNAGDNYWLDCTVTVAATQARVGGDAVQTMERTLVRRIAIQVYAG